MNIIANNPILRITAFCLVGALTILTSCERNDNLTEGRDVPDMNTQFMLQPPAISVEPFGGNTPATRAAVAIKEERQAFNVGEELGNIITLGNSETEDTPQTRAFAAGTYYRIVVYKLSEWNAGTLKVHEQRLCKTGSTDYFANAGDVITPIYLYPGDYRIFCYSFNKTTVDKLSPLADGAVNVPLTSGDDFLSSDIISKSITVSQIGVNVALGTVTLKHRCCRIIGTLTAESFTSTGIATSPTPSLNVTSTFFTTGNWSIKNTSFSGSATSSVAKAIPLIKSGNNYTGTLLLLPLTSKALAANYTFKPNGATKNVTASNKSISGSATFASGGSYSFTIKALGANVITDGVESLKIGSYTWATRNVRWNNTFETNLDIWNSGNLRGASQGTTSNAAQNSDYNSYFMWGNKNAFVSGGSYETGSSWSSSKNPCPSGYSVPSKTQLENLIMKMVPKNTRVSINGEIFTINSAYGFYNGNKTKGLVLKDGVNVLFLPAAGYRSGTNWTYVGIYGFYWVTAPDGNRAYGLDFSNDWCGVDCCNDRNFGFSVRCVK